MLVEKDGRDELLSTCSTPSYAGTSHVEHKPRSIFEDSDTVLHLEKDSLNDAAVQVQKVTTKIPATKKSAIDCRKLQKRRKFSEIWELTWTHSITWAAAGSHAVFPTSNQHGRQLLAHVNIKTIQKC
ncbi:hypothetical protein Y032_0260g520 [Ancylostoma ceylanicum]|uniref:Uncharacterized protein n=1 Tax=Ancylostoma ceylanicum TaxID=53326 RepID=A0A016SA95_9BILA|nr:hypothetical protein Y032_0260g520 [Ancylostoma ceylanicum]